MSVNRDKLDLRLIEETIFWEFWELFSKFCNRRRSDLPQYKTPAFKLDPFKLAEIFYDCNDDPSPALLMDAVEFRSPLMEKVFEDYYETLSHHLLDGFKAARQQLRIDQHTETLVQGSPSNPACLSRDCISAVLLPWATKQNRSQYVRPLCHSTEHKGDPAQ